jgi:hypothetical protein
MELVEPDDPTGSQTFDCGCGHPACNVSTLPAEPPFDTI